MAPRAIQLLKTNSTWSSFETDWKAQCGKYGENFEEYSSGTFSVLRDIIDKEHGSAGVFAFCEDEIHSSICQLNIASIPGYSGPVLRVRFLTMCPELDFGDHPLEKYASALVHAFAGIMHLSDDHPTYAAKHIKFHLRSPNDRQFFSILGSGLSEADEFESVRMTGSWLYITKS